MKAKLQIEIKSDEQMAKIFNAEESLIEAGIIFDKGMDLDRNIREWEFDRIEGAKLLVEEDNRLSIFTRIQTLRHMLENAEMTDTNKIVEAHNEITKLEKELENL